jgi:hypothetical protein
MCERLGTVTRRKVEFNGRNIGDCVSNLRIRRSVWFGNGSDLK